MKGTVKRSLQALGLLPAARGLRDSVRSAAAWPRNARLRRIGAPDGLPLPPGRLMVLVAGEPDVSWFLEAGRRGAESIRSVLARNGIAIEDVRRLLDFGCGCGRVLRYWKDLPGEVHGSDLNPRLVEWCRRHLPFGRYEVNGLAPPLACGDARFDLVYALSVFTHLPEELQLAWMAEMRRVIRPGGSLILTTHGASYAGVLRPEERARFAAGRLVVVAAEHAGDNVCGAYHPEAYVRSTLAAGFSVLDFAPEGAAGNPHQDLFLLQRD